MAKQKSIYSCQKCGAQSPKWVGRCGECGAWNSYVEETIVSEKGYGDGQQFFALTSDAPTALPDIQLEDTKRLTCHLGEFDRVLGGGFVPGSLVLIGGDPGIGKSTLILQALDRLAQNQARVLYVTGEESKEQIKLRAARLGISSHVLVLAENSMERIVDQVQKIKPNLLVVDSIQTVYLGNLQSAPGSVSQIRECAGKLLYLSKSTGIATVLIGHVTKDGSVAGPRVLEHLVDCVMYFEGDSHQDYRLLRAIKNRYGSTNEIGVFEMTSLGLMEVKNPSSLFMSDPQKQVLGSALGASLEGARPFLVEIQALVSSSVLANPRRNTLGVDANRVSMLVAVLEKVAGLNLYGQDIYVNAAGGFKVVEPAADLAIVAALVSSFKNRPLAPNCLILGEVGLSGEIRPVNGLEIRLKEACKLGIKKCILPKNKHLQDSTLQIEMHFVESVCQVLDVLF